MKRLLAMLLCAAMLICCASICVFAEEETTEAAATEETTEEKVSEQTPTHIVFNSELTGKKNLVSSYNHMAKGTGTVSKSGEWKGVKIEIDNPEDPHVGLDISKFFKRFEFEPLTVEKAPFIVIKVLTDDIAFDDFELYYCAGDVVAFAEDYKTSSDYALDSGNGEVYFVFDLTGDAEGEYIQFRVDIVGADSGALMYMTDVVFFATESEALDFCGYNDQETEAPTTQETTTEEPENTTEEPTTEAQTKKPEKTTEAQTEDEGCGSVIGAGLVTLSLIALGAACIKKKD